MSMDAAGQRMLSADEIAASLRPNGGGHETAALVILGSGLQDSSTASML